MTQEGRETLGWREGEAVGRGKEKERVNKQEIISRMRGGEGRRDRLCGSE